VKKKRKKSTGLVHFLMALLFLVLAAGISHVWVNFKRTQIGYTLSQVKKELVQIEGYNRKLKLEIAFLKSPEFLEERAMREFGLQHPLPEQIVFLP